MYIALFLPLKLKILNIIYKINIRKILKGIKTRDLRTQGMTWGEFLGFSFCLIYPKLGAEEVRSLETITGTD